MSDPFEPSVFLVGAGPGDPGLLTVRAAELLATADLILHDQLVPARILDLAKPGAEIISVRDLPGHHPDKYPHIYTLLIDAARAGKRVVRLKGGDPLIFGRGGEEAESLRHAGIRYEIVPGVTAALAAGACLELPLTHRLHSSAVALITGHELPGKPGTKLDWQALAGFPGTLAIYMGISRLPIIVAELQKRGKDPNTPAGIIERASTGDMRTVFAPLKDLEQARRHAGLESPGLILIGEVVDQRAAQSWFEQRPLFGRRVLVTRPRHQAGAMLRRLEQLGAVTYQLPTVEIREPKDLTPLDEVQHRLHDWDWLVFTSVNGVSSFFQRLFQNGLDLRAVGHMKFATVGTRTAEELRKYHLNPDVVPPSFIAESLVESLKEQVRGRRVLLARANRGRDLIRQELSRLAASVDQVVVYEQSDASIPDAEVMGALRRGEIGFVTVTSSNIARALIAAFDETIRGRVQRGEIRIVAISPETGNAVRELGLPVAAEATTFTSDGVVDAVVRLVSREG